MVKDLTVAQLENMLQKRKLKLEGLQKQRDRLRKQLAVLEKQIVAVGGDLHGAIKKRRRRPKNTKTLLATVTETLTKHKHGLGLRDLATKILESGYKTSSTNFHNTLYQVLYHNSDRLAHDPKTHTYGLKQLRRRSRPIRQPVAGRKNGRPISTNGAHSAEETLVRT
jgi:hypothetical protein